MPDAEEVHQLELDLRSKSEERRKEAYRRALELDDSAAPTLVRWLAESNVDLRQAAHDALRRHATQQTADALIEKLKNPHGSYWMERFILKAISLLEVIPDPRVPEVLTHLLKSENERVVNRALIGLKTYAAHHLNEDNPEVDAESIADRLMMHLSDALKKKPYLKESWTAHLLFLMLAVFWGTFLWSHRETEYGPYVSILILPLIFIWLAVSLVTASYWRRSPDTQNHSIRALRAYGDIRAIGMSAIHAQKPRLARSAQATLATILAGMKEDSQMELSKEQMAALLSFLRGNNRRLRTAILRAMPSLADETALESLESLSRDEKAPLSQEERRLLARVLPQVRERIERLKAKRILLRAASYDSEAEMLLRPANYHPELPNEQLLRPVENEKEE